MKSFWPLDGSGPKVAACINKGASMRVGRRPVPRVLHELHGNPSKKRLRDIKEPETRGPLGPPPRFLDKDARAVWLDLQDVMPVAVLASCDLPLVTSYCHAVAQ